MDDCVSNEIVLASGLFMFLLGIITARFLDWLRFKGKKNEI